jgi:GNAT superfamily N-acetyltransferase
MNRASIPPRSNAFRVRAATLEDAARLAVLSSQLGYPATAEEMKRRLKAIERLPDNLVLVAQLDGGLVVAWAHAYVRPTLENEPSAEIAGLVVDASWRGQGAGRTLMDHVERWARGAGCAAVTLRSNIIRDGAHKFYEGLGYARIKTQHAFQKKMAGAK